MTLYTTAQVAERLGLSRRRVLALALSRGLGRKLGRDWIFDEEDIEGMQIRVAGRPWPATTAVGRTEPDVTRAN